MYRGPTLSGPYWKRQAAEIYMKHRKHFHSRNGNGKSCPHDLKSISKGLEMGKQKECSGDCQSSWLALPRTAVLLLVAPLILKPGMHLTAVWPQASYLKSQSLSFIIN